MNEGRYSSRDHDAEWILQKERVHTDMLTQKNAGARRTGSYFARGAPQVIEESTPSQRESTRKRLTAAAARLGASDDDLQTVLDMLGISEQALVTRYTALGNRRKPHGACRTCGRPSIALRRDRTLVSHTPRPGMRLDDTTRCLGSGRHADKAFQVDAPVPKAVPTPAPADRGPKPVQVDTECRDDPELFFPASYGPSHARQVEEAKGACGRCPVAAACLRYALDIEEYEHGIWGGTTPHERRDLTRKAAA
ncbi:WhiB family transcriptional regulator [Nonomuraea sp. NPDC050790]|uniref:WhiB family transcriptional regulator n=1 Tax=Nonomuraea sp. NPDC050790 TaxID=3364371 RepID=UPI0037A107D8